jgi:citrate synthase
MSTTTVAKQGLEDVVVGESAISTIVDASLTYKGYDIDDLTDNAINFEEVVFLLWEGRLPNKTELDKLVKDLGAAATIPAEIITLIKSMPKTANPMDVLRTAVSMLGVTDPQTSDDSMEANKAKALRLQAQMGTLVAAFERIRNGQEPIAPKAEWGIAKNFLYMMTGSEPEALYVKAFDKALILHADHEYNASTFSSRQTASTLSDMHSCITTAIGTLKGPLHGGANTAVMKMLEEIGTVENVEPWIAAALAKKAKIMGFGHRVYKNGDPRAKHLRAMSKEMGERQGNMKWYDMSVKVEDFFVSQKNLLPNVDFYSASTYHYMGIPGDQFTPIFAISRTSGWCAHVLEQLGNNRLIRPRADYTGPLNQKYAAIETR